MRGCAGRNKYLSRSMYSEDFKKAALMIYNYLGSMRKAAIALKICTASISRWCKGIPLGVWPKRGSVVTDGMIAMMKLKLKEFPSTSTCQLKEHLREVYGVHVSRQLIHSILRTRLGYSWKRIRKRGPKESSWSSDQIQSFKTKFVDAYNSGNLSSWDESSFDQRAHAIYGYAPFGQRAILHVPKNKCKHRHYSLLMGMHMDGTRSNVV